jgi:hypothetical protein
MGIWGPRTKIMGSLFQIYLGKRYNRDRVRSPRCDNYHEGKTFLWFWQSRMHRHWSEPPPRRLVTSGWTLTLTARVPLIVMVGLGGTVVLRRGYSRATLLRVVSFQVIVSTYYSSSP